MARNDISPVANAHRGTYLEDGSLLVDFGEKARLSKPAPNAASTVALVLMHSNAVPNAAVVRMALDAGVQAVLVALPEDSRLAQRIEGMLPQDRRVSCARITAAESEKARLDARNYELFGVPAQLLRAGRDLLREHAGAQARDLLILDGAQTAIRPRHLRELCGRLAAFPDTDVVTSWIIWFRRKPLLVSGHYLDELDERIEAACACETGYGLIQHLRVQEVVFGEEPLAAPPAKNAQVERFFGECGITAIEAVRLARAAARYEAAHETAPATTETPAPNTSSPGSGTASEDPLSKLSAAELHLVGIARETLTMLEPARTALGDELEEASAWGARNRQDFPLLCDGRQRNLAYLDSAATTQRCFRALAAEQNFSWHENANVYRGGYDLSMRATETLNDARKVMEDFIGAERRTTVFTANATGGLNLVAQAWGMRNIARGDLIVCALSDHHSNILPWQLLARERKARIVYVPLDSRGSIDRDAFAHALEMRPKLVCLTHASNVLGKENPLYELAQEAHSAGARVSVDGAQGFPHFSVDVKALGEAGVDFYAFSAHKVYGPTGIGGLWISQRAFKEMEPLASGGGAISHVSPDSHYWRLGTIRFEPGTPDVAAACGFAGALEYVGNLGAGRVHAHADLLTRYLVSGLRRLDFVSIWGMHADASGSDPVAQDAAFDARHAGRAESGTVSFSVGSVDPGVVGRVLGKLGVAIRSGGHCAFPLSASLGLLGSARISVGVYNTAEDIEAALVAVRACRKLIVDA